MMDERLRRHIGEIYDGGCWEKISAVMWQDGQPWELWKFEQDVKFEGATYRCVIIERDFIDPDDASAIDHAEDIFAEAWEI